VAKAPLKKAYEALSTLIVEQCGGSKEKVKALVEDRATLEAAKAKCWQNNNIFASIWNTHKIEMEEPGEFGSNLAGPVIKFIKGKLETED
jgi:hypothetical protein